MYPCGVCGRGVRAIQAGMHPCGVCGRGVRVIHMVRYTCAVWGRDAAVIQMVESWGWSSTNLSSSDRSRDGVAWRKCQVSW